MKKLLLSIGVLGSCYAAAQTGNVGVNTKTPQTVLDVNGNTRIQQLPTAAGTITYGGASATYAPVNTVVADANGVLGIVAGLPTVPAATNFWTTVGNAGTVVGTGAGTNFLGTTDSAPLQFRVNNTQAGLISVLSDANTALGYNAAPWMASPNGNRENAAFGTGALAAAPAGANTVGQNIAVGVGAMSSLIKGGTNIAIGYQAMGQSTAGDSNIAIGLKSLHNINTANNNWGNMAMGFLSGNVLTTGNRNIIFSNYTAGSKFQSGSNNILIGGQNAGNGLVTGDSNIAIGATTSLADATSNQLNIGNTIYGTGISTTAAKIGMVTSPTSVPTETFDVNGTARVRQLPASGTGTIYNGAATANTIFTGTRTVVADANGVLGTVAGLPSSGGGITAVNGTSPVTSTTSGTTTTIGIMRNDLTTAASSQAATAPVTITNGAGAVVNGANTTIGINNTAPLWNANQIQGTSVSNTAPSAGQVLTYDATMGWTPKAAQGNNFAVWGLFDVNTASRYTSTGAYSAATISSSTLTAIPNSDLTVTVPAGAANTKVVLNWGTTWRKSTNTSPGIDNALFKITVRKFSGATQVGSDVVIGLDYIYNDAVQGRYGSTLSTSYVDNNPTAGTYTYRIYIGNSEIYNSYSIELYNDTLTGEAKVYAK